MHITKYYAEGALSGENPVKIINILRATNVIRPTDHVIAVLGKRQLWGITDSIILTDDDVIYFNNTKAQLGTSFRHPYSSLTSAAMKTPFPNIGTISITIGGAQCLDMDTLAPITEACLALDLIQRKMSEASADEQHDGRVSAADEIKKFKELLDAEAITQEEYNAKKKQLLGL